MDLRFPAPLRPGDTVGVTSPSSGVAGAAAVRIDFCVGWLRERGYRVVVGDCMDGAGHVSAPREERAAELTAMLTDPAVHAVVPPWGGVTAIDLLDLLDWDAIAAARPTWLVGFSDLSTVMTPLLLRTGLASVHGENLADTPYAQPAGLAGWLDVVAATEPVAQRDPGLVADWYRFEEDTTATTWKEVGRGTWSTLEGAPRADVSGRLVGGCIETVGALAGTPYGDVPAFGREHGPLLVYLEASDDDAYTICRHLHQLRYAGWFDHAAGVLVGRTSAPDAETMTQREAVADALGTLGVPVLLDLPIGHVPPHLPLVNGALARVVLEGDVREVTQCWPGAGR